MDPMFSTTVGGASVPVPGGEFYYGTVSEVIQGQVKVNVPMLGFVSVPIDYLNSYGNDPYQAGERVVVGFLEGGKQHLLVFGRLNHRDIVFPTYAEYLAAIARIETLEGEVDVLQGQVTTLEGQVGTLETDVSTLQTTVVSLQNQIDGKADSGHSHA